MKEVVFKMKFIRYNANPKGKKTGDCVIRAICTALNKTWEDTYREMLEVAIKYGYAVSTKDNYTKYLKQLGYEKQKMPKRCTGKRYKIEEFIDELCDKNKTYIIDMANHVTVVSKNVLYDIWDCSNKSVCNYWIVDETFTKESNFEIKKRKRGVEL